MKNLTTSQVRQMFLDFFKEKGHMIEPGAALVPHNDPTLLWINSGVAALKKYFDGSEKPKSNRIVNAQKSIRTNDIENVGKTARHHTFFEMLGNFSIGDYFKEEAIAFAWEFLTSEKWIGFDKERLYVSVYADDEVAYNTWVNVIKVDPSHILKTYDNFWEIGEGPGGPNSEIFYDRGIEFDPENIGEKLFFEELENDRYIEVWNVVFSQYNCKPELDRKDYQELPQKNIDTGMGLERLVSIIQGGETNFDTDTFLPLIREVEKYAQFPYENEHKMAYRVIADHIRTVTFAISDGAAFSNEGRGYVLRRVLRRAVRYGIKLKIQGAFMYKLVDLVAENMKDFYPYLVERKELVAKLVKIEEETFATTLNNGEKLLQEALENTTDVLSGEIIFKLYDTYGFPKELTVEIAEEKGLKVDNEGFEKCMEEQRSRARNSRVDEQSMSSQSEDLMNFTDDFEFVGYNEIENDAKITGCFINGQQVNEISDEGQIILDKTCFYAESGGQIADTGVIKGKNFELQVLNVIKAPHHQHLHHIKVISGKVCVNDTVHASIDLIKRVKIKANHSSIHLLQSALKEILGDHIAQAGSYAGDEYSRFDFTHFEKLTDQQLHEVENRVNQMIMQNNEVKTDLMSIEEAKVSGAIALFDEKYSDLVRVVSMGDVSNELCGGTHVANTQEIGVYKILSEESIGSGIRRITAKTKMNAYLEYVGYQDTLKSISSMLKMNSINNVDDKVHQILEENNSLRKVIASLNQKMLILQADEMVAQAESINGINLIIKKLENADSSSLKSLAETLKNKCENSFVFLANVVDEDKVIFVAASSQEAIKRGMKAGDIVKLAATTTGGNGGGRPDLAQAGGKDCSKLDEVFALIKEKI